MFAFPLRCLERHLPLVDDIIAVGFLAKVPRNFARICGSWVEWFGVFINIVMKSPFETTWTFPEFNGIDTVRVEELPQFTKNRCSVELERVRFAIENFLCHVNGISYDDDLGDVIDGAGLVDTTPNSEQFRLCACHEWSMVNCFGERTIRWVDMRNGRSNIIFNASICYHKGCMG